MKISLLVSTYRNPRFLELVLESICRQDHPVDEVLVCEDGAALENRAVVSEYARRLPLRHVTQLDRGNRKPIVQNKGILAATGDYLILVDGDCVLRGDFVRAHVELAGPDRFLTGRRVELSPAATRALSAERIRAGYLDGWPWALYRDALFGETQSLGRFFRTPGFLRGVLGRNRVDDIRGCNFSVAREALVAINGFSNDFSGAYGEDSDVEYRLKFHGLRMASCKGAAIQFHLWHPTQTKDAENQTRLQAVLEAGVARAANGLAEAAGIP